jgi:hypothetical protein
MLPVRLAFISGVIAVSACSLSPEPETHCENSYTLQTESCSWGDCATSSQTCDSGVCVESSYGHAYCSGPPLCKVALPSQSICIGGSLYECDNGATKKVTSCPDVCVTAGTQAVCATSTERWPACDASQPSQSLCEGNAIRECQYGYLVSETDSSQACSVGWHCESSGAAVSCVRDGAPLSDACLPDDMSVHRCRGNLAIQCQLGRIIANQKCKTCANGVCQGGFGATCQTDTDCADGFVCWRSPVDGAASADFSICTLPCEGAANDNPTCLAVEVDTSLPYDSFFGKCSEGYCRP